MGDSGFHNVWQWQWQEKEGRMQDAFYLAHLALKERTMIASNRDLLDLMY